MQVAKSRYTSNLTITAV